MYSTRLMVNIGIFDFSFGHCVPVSLSENDPSLSSVVGCVLDFFNGIKLPSTARTSIVLRVVDWPSHTSLVPNMKILRTVPVANHHKRQWTVSSFIYV